LQREGRGKKEKKNILEENVKEKGEPGVPEKGASSGRVRKVEGFLRVQDVRTQKDSIGYKGGTRLIRRLRGKKISQKGRREVASNLKIPNKLSLGEKESRRRGVSAKWRTEP